MRRDGTVTSYHPQHRYPDAEWCDSACGEFLFHDLTYEQNRGPLGDHYRKLLKPQHACWQWTGSHAFLDVNDALEVLRELRSLPLGTRRRLPEFRLISRTITQVTDVVA